MKNKKKFLIGGSIILILIIGTIIFLNYQKNKQPDYKLIALSGAEFKAKIKARDTFVLVIHKDGCSHCEDYLPVFEDISQNYKLTAYKLNLTKLSADEYSYLNGFVANIGTPLTMFFEKGAETSSLNRIEGNVGRDKVISRLKTMGYIK